MENTRLQKQSEMFSLVKEYKLSSVPILAFCRDRDILPTTFRYWLNKFNREQNQDSDNGFVRLLPESVDLNNVELCYPNGVVIRISAALADSQRLGSLVKLW